jgi:hypothetical protein
MATNLIKMTIQFRRDTAANWDLYKNQVPAVGEPCFVIDENILKIGDGVTTFENLKPINGVQIDTDGKSLIFKDGALKLAGLDEAEVGAQPRKAADGSIEWVVPSTKAIDDLSKTVSGLKSDVTSLQDSVKDLKEIVTPSGEGSVTLLQRIESLENGKVGEDYVDAKIDEKINAFAENVSADGTVNTLKELIDYVVDHGADTTKILSDIANLKGLVGTDSVANQISSAINNSGHISKDEAIATLLSKVEAKTTLEHVKYEIVSTPAGTLVDYRDKEIRVMVPAETKWVKQNVGSTGNENMYYMGFKAYAPEDAVSFKEGDRGVIVDEMFTFDNDFAGIDVYGRKYSICWLALASYDADSDTWTYFGKNSSINKYVGWTYVVEWYDANGVVIGSDSIRINLSNENCHNNIEPFYMANFVKEVSANGTLLDMVDGKIDIAIDNIIKTSDEIAINKDGTLSIKSISFDKITQAVDDKIVLNGGGAAG